MMKTIKPLFTLFLSLPLLCGAADFVKVKGAHFIRDNKPYYFIGANFWQGMNLGSKRSYADEPAIMSWQLANEPRGSYNSAAFNEGSIREDGFTAGRRGVLGMGRRKPSAAPRRSVETRGSLAR